MNDENARNNLANMALGNLPWPLRSYFFYEKIKS